jgi:hypothetical protein
VGVEPTPVPGANQFLGHPETDPPAALNEFMTEPADDKQGSSWFTDER